MVVMVFVIRFAASGSETVVFRAFKFLIAGHLSVLVCNLPSRALAWSFLQCSIYINQFTILKGSHFA